MKSGLSVKYDLSDMFSPQFFEAVCRAGFSAREWTVVMTVIGKTYGCGQKEREISLSQLAQMTDIDKSNLSRTVRDLVTAGVLMRRPGSLLTFIIAFNLKYDEWFLPARHAMTQPVALQNAGPLSESKPSKINTEASNIELRIPSAEKSKLWLIAEIDIERTTVVDSTTTILSSAQLNRNEKTDVERTTVVDLATLLLGQAQSQQQEKEEVEPITVVDLTSVVLSEEQPQQKKIEKKEKNQKKEKTEKKENIFCGASKKAVLNETAQAALDYLNGVD
jgi:phage replication O-like protein O